MKKRVPNNHIDRETRERIVKKQAFIVNMLSTDEDLKLVGPKTQKEIGKALYMSQSTVSSRQKTYDNCFYLIKSRNSFRNIGCPVSSI